ncbi:hypothetical protein D6T65_00515 [Arthrobacter frigidicola]|nr:hypothetical protein D6T65_00515 [Arthrobacter frigidicola]
MRIRQGLYVTSERWAALDRWDRYRMRVLAVHLAAHRPPVFCHETAALVHGLPLVTVPSHVHVQQIADGSAHSRGGVRRHCSSLAAPPVTQISGLQVTSLESTIVALAVGSGFPAGVLALDDALRRGMTNLRQVSELAQMTRTAAAQKRITAVLDFSCGDAESPGESLSRVQMMVMGFPVPELQHVFSDARGLIGRVDFYWPQARLVGEFDGLVKYSKPEYLNGRTPSEVVIEEKRREDRLRALGLRVVRWTWDDLRDPALLRDLLTSAGLVPGRPVIPGRVLRARV